MQKAQYEDEREQAKHDNFFKYATFAEKAAKSGNKQLFESAISLAGKYAIDNNMMPQMDFDRLSQQGANERNQSLDLHLMDKGYRRAVPQDFEDQEAGMSVMPPPGQLYMGDQAVLPMPKSLPVEPIGMEYMSDAEGNLRALPKSVMPGQVPMPMETGMKVQPGGPGGASSTAEMKNYQFLTSNLGLKQDEAMAIAYGINAKGEKLSASQRASLAQGVARPIQEAILKLKVNLPIYQGEDKKMALNEIAQLEAQLAAYKSIVDSSLDLGGEKKGGGIDTSNLKEVAPGVYELE